VQPATSELPGHRLDGWTDGRQDGWKYIFILFGWMDWTNDGMDNQTDSGEASFLIPTSFTIYTICVYRSHSSLISMFLNTLEASIQKSPNDCPLIALGVNWESS